MPRLVSRRPPASRGIGLVLCISSLFAAAACTVSDRTPVATGTEGVWLAIDEQTQVPAGLDPFGDGRAYRVALIGREAKHARRPPNGYGHGGMFGELVVVDRIVSATDLGLAPEP